MTTACLIDMERGDGDDYSFPDRQSDEDKNSLSAEEARSIIHQLSRQIKDARPTRNSGNYSLTDLYGDIHNEDYFYTECRYSRPEPKLEDYRPDNQSFFLSHVRCIWLMPLEIQEEYIDTRIDDFSDIQSQTQQIFGTTNIFYRIKEFYEDLEKATQNKEKVVLILLPTDTGRKIIPFVHHLEIIELIYICDFNTNSHTGTGWLCDYPKLMGIFSDKTSMRESLKQHTAEMAAAATPTTVFTPPPAENSMNVLLTSSHFTFIWYQLLLTLLLEKVPVGDNAKKQLVHEARMLYKDNQTEKEKIDAFVDWYDPNNDIYLYIHVTLLSIVC